MGCSLPRSVLIVEDHPFQRKVLMKKLAAMGVARVGEAEDGVQALALLASAVEPFDVVVTDLDMPTMDGLALMREIGLRAPQAGVIVLSSAERDLLSTVSWLGREQGIKLIAVLEKPVSSAALLNAFERFISSSRGLKRNVSVFGIDAIGAGLEAGQFEAFVQPKIRLCDGAIVGGEALARWRHPQLGLILPGAFISPIEVSSLVKPFSIAMLQNSAWAVRWLEDSGLPGRIAINASPAWLDQSTMAEQLSEAVADLCLPVERLSIEVTESVANGNLAAALENLARLRLRGFSLSVDDFGTGFSSLLRLVSSPFSELKLDRSFVSGVERDTSRWFVVESTIALAKKLGLATVAEGVETEEELRLMKDAGCDFVQGYYFAKPMNREDFVLWAQEYSKDDHASRACPC